MDGPLNPFPPGHSYWHIIKKDKIRMLPQKIFQLIVICDLSCDLLLVVYYINLAVCILLSSSNIEYHFDTATKNPPGKLFIFGLHIITWLAQLFFIWIKKMSLYLAKVHSIFLPSVAWKEKLFQSYGSSNFFYWYKSRFISMCRFLQIISATFLQK